MSNLLGEKIAVVIGGTGGIGAATARRLAQDGAKVVVCGQTDIQKARQVSSIQASYRDVATTSIARLPRPHPSAGSLRRTISLKPSRHARRT